MLSICIPIYNFNVTNLVKQLSVQSEQLGIAAEIILIDDGSEDEYKKANELVCSEQVYIKLEKNIGRAAIRNRFLNYAKYDYLLFLDCDSIINSKDFLVTYIKAIKQYPNLPICGGRTYEKKPPNRTRLLRWKYGINKESKNYKIRSRYPNRSFMTHNFVIPKHILQTIQFDERLVKYGHEDTLFGFELKKRDISIVHIDNAILNGDLEQNTNYLDHTEKAIYNLVQILEFNGHNSDFINDVSLLRSYFKLHKFRKFIMFVFVFLKPLLKYALTKGFINLYVFDFYKLGILSVQMNNKG